LSFSVILVHSARTRYWYLSSRRDVLKTNVLYDFRYMKHDVSSVCIVILFQLSAWRILLYSIYYVNEGVSSVSGVDHYAIIMKLLDLILTYFQCSYVGGDSDILTQDFSSIMLPTQSITY
jgi:hypothetical protein